MRAWIFVSAVLGLLTLAVLSGFRGYPLEMGLMSAVGVASLSFATLQTVAKLVTQYREERGETQESEES